MTILDQAVVNVRLRLQSFSLLFLIIWSTGSSCKKDTLATVDVDKNEVTVFAGISDTVTIRSDAGEWQVHSGDNDVATAKIENDKLIIHTHKHGITHIYLASTNQSIQIKVTVNPLGGGWHFSRDTSEPVILVADAAVAAMIREALLYDEVNRIRKSYMFSSDGRCEVITTNMLTHSTESVQGNFTLQNSVLTVTYNGFSNIYTLAAPPQLRLLQQDLTSYYQQKYPDAGIERVTVHYRLQYFTYG